MRRNRENIQSESATKGYVQDINLSEAFEQSGRNANVSKQEEEVAVSVVSSSSDEVMSQQGQMAQLQRP